MELGTMFTLWQHADEASVAIAPECQPLIERAMKLWSESRRDTWLSLQTPSGAEFCVLASTITCVMLSTVQQRADAHHREKAIEDERKAMRLDAGFIESE